MQFFGETSIDFLGKRKIAFIVSGVLILIGIVSLIIKGGPSYGIDFVGGTEVSILYSQDKQTSTLRDALASIGFGKAEIKQFGSPRSFLVRVQEQETGTEVSDKIVAALTQASPDDPPELRSVDSVGPKIGKELRTSAALSILISLALIMLYISVRFEFIFAVGSVIALFHDVLITLGIFSILDLEISLAIIAAFLTLIGYSLNDTIVVFDRIRENFNLNRRESEATHRIINTSINQTLSRTVLTSGTTLIVIVVLFIFGGDVIHNFALCMLAGIVVGTYSSIFVASPVVAQWHQEHTRKKARTKRPVRVR